MKRVHVLSTVMAAAISCGVLCERALGQAEIEVLVWDSVNSGTARRAGFSLGYSVEWAGTEAQYIAAMQRQSWDLVVWEVPRVTHSDPKTALQLLDDHITAGGRAIINYNDLDSWPELQTLLGLDDAIERSERLAVLALDPPHCTWLGTDRMNYVGGVPYPDPGDFLVPGPGSVALATFSNGLDAIVLSLDDRVIVNGYDWENYGGASPMARSQFSFLMSCRADLDQSTGAGVLDIFDFLEFQDKFVHEHPCANFAFDANFDIFDFLAFQNAFVSGCD